MSVLKSVPCAVLSYTLTNVTQGPVAVTLAGSLGNPIGGVTYDDFGSVAKTGVGQNLNTFRDQDGLRGLFFASEQFAPDALPTL